MSNEIRPDYHHHTNSNLEYALVLLLLLISGFTLNFWVLHETKPASVTGYIRGLTPQYAWRPLVCLRNLTASQPECTIGNLDSHNKALLQVLENKYVALIGDSRVRDLFVYMRSILMNRPFLPWAFSEDVLYYNKPRNITIKFYWCPLPDGRLEEIVGKWHWPKKSPHYAVLGLGAWSLYQFGANGTQNFTVPGRLKTLQDLPGTPVNSSYQLMEDYGKKVMSIAANNKRSILWSSAHYLALANQNLYRDLIHPGRQLLETFACQLLSALDLEHCTLQ